MTFLDVHVLQSVPPSNLNRDESGSPKTATYGGVLRARVSSQAWKRAVRDAFLNDPNLAKDGGLRTRQLPRVIGDAVTARRPALGAASDVIGTAATLALFKKVKLAKNKPITEYLLFLGHDQVERVADALVAADLEEVVEDPDQIRARITGLDLHELGIKGHAGAVALFGRMVADAPELNVDAACQVAHALSTHKVVSDQFDYFTAVDDESRRQDETGAGMIGTIEFNSATLYRFATVSMRDLIANLDGETDRALDLALAFAKTFATAMPTGKQNTFAAHTRPDLIMINVRADQPVSLAGAFEEPVRAPEGGIVPASVAQLVTYHSEQDKMYGTSPLTSALIYPAWLGDRVNDEKQIELPPAQPLDTALDTVRATLGERITQ
ncbi:type I-E CRISPR-associated protein Cas7/Cse4/CasC [Actinomadura chibensis]|uniref:Type I-E CRISPR-associated protein Cas7/Cse4/CasC n=1 Tax=Actinomadura chibensis TaxID=392828 RepID=A0A5D0NHI7_9ACTN|nr:type I-E CRISPR-associated protein Cas7/Cse4/CasC [Actinomadura chibensis]TYB43887.1 type I-E CRISPR-associated protein Cas7/Cse4/CasC [Actinomadura chibensis]